MVPPLQIGSITLFLGFLALQPFWFGQVAPIILNQAWSNSNHSLDPDDMEVELLNLWGGDVIVCQDVRNRRGLCADDDVMQWLALC